MNYIKHFFVTSFLATAVLITCQSALADQEQSIVVVNQDGEEVEANQLKIRLQVDDDKPKNFSIEDGKITIVNKDGTTREIDVAGARTIVVNKAVESIIEDGQEKNRVRGKAIVIGPDGVRQEFVIGEGGLGELKIPMPPALDGLMDGRPKWGNFPSELNMGWNGGKYMVGVNCRPVDEAMAAQLDLPENTGLIVSESPTPESPAATAGIQKFDILLYADQAELASTKNLVEVVQKAGKDESAISFTILRKGKQISVDIQPAERPAIQRGEMRFINPDGENGPGVFKWDQIGPGMVFEGKLDELMNRKFLRQTEEMHRMMEEQAKRLNQLQMQFKNFEGKNK